MIELSVINKSNNPLPKYQTKQSAGVDLQAFIESDVVIKPMERVLIGTGIYIALPDGFEAMIRPRSGMAYKHGISVINTPGTIDADYRGEIGVILVNLSNEDFTIENGERIAQLIIAKHERADWVQVETLSETDRGEGGFGSTGVK